MPISYNTMNASMAVDGIFFWCLFWTPDRIRPRESEAVRRALISCSRTVSDAAGAGVVACDTDYYPSTDLRAIWDIRH